VKKDHDWVRLAIIYLGLFGAALAIAGMMIALPAQATGTCGPGTGSESAAIAFFDPVTIGAQAEPPTSDQAARTQWTTFVHGCQSAADTRMLITLPLLAVSVGLVILGVILILRRNRRRVGSGPGRWNSARAMVASGSGNSLADPDFAPSFGETHAALSRPAMRSATALATRPRTTDTDTDTDTDTAKDTATDTERESTPATAVDQSGAPDPEPAAPESELTPIELGPATTEPESGAIGLGRAPEQSGE